VERRGDDEGKDKKRDDGSACERTGMRESESAREREKRTRRRGGGGKSSQGRCM